MRRLHPRALTTPSAVFVVIFACFSKMNTPSRSPYSSSVHHQATVCLEQRSLSQLPTRCTPLPQSWRPSLAPVRPPERARAIYDHSARGQVELTARPQVPPTRHETLQLLWTVGPVDQRAACGCVAQSGYTTRLYGTLDRHRCCSDELNAAHASSCSAPRVYSICRLRRRDVCADGIASAASWPTVSAGGWVK